MSRDYFAIALQYARDVVDGKITACEYVQAACQRQLHDLDRENFKYVFDVRKAHRACAFIEKLPHIKGKWAGKKIHLEPWQVFIVTTVFGWVDANGLRRFKTVYIEVPRKNAKSTLSSAIALYCLVADGEAGAEVYSAATTRDQARIVWRDAKRMVDRCKGLRQRFKVETSAHSIYSEQSASAFFALSRDQGGNLDGLNVHCAVIDELHAHKTRDVFDVIETATGAREQPLLWLITTAGFNRAGICYEQRIYITKILNASHVDEEYFGIIYSLDKDDDWTDPNVWQKANPNWGVSVNPEDIERKCRKAMRMTSAQNNFLTKHLNLWVNADSAWMDVKAWERCANPYLTPQTLAGRKCYVAADLSSKIDIASVAYVFPRDDGHFDAIVKHYLPELTIVEASNSQYEGWQTDGFITATPGAKIDYQTIENDIKAFAKLFEIVEVGFDPWQSNYIATNLAKEGLEIIEIRNTVQNMSDPMKELEALALDGKFHHDGCPVLDWMVSNVVCHTDAKSNIFPRKELPENKIDGVVALIMAIGRATTYETDEDDELSSHLETHGLRRL